MLIKISASSPVILEPDYTRTLLSENSRNPDRFWAAIKRVFLPKAKNVKSEKSFVINGIKSTKPNEIANDFCNYFSTIVSTLKQTLHPLIYFTWRKPQYLRLRTYKSFHFGYVSVTEVTQLLKKLKCKKAAVRKPQPLTCCHFRSTYTHHKPFISVKCISF